MGSKLYSQRDVWRMMAALGVFVVVPCVLLVFLAWQSVRVLHEAALAQRREALRHELRDIGRMVSQHLDDWLRQASEPLRAQPPSESVFWSAALRHLDAEKGIQAVLALDSAGNLVFPRPGRGLADDLPRLSSVHPACAALQAARRAHWVDGDPGRALEHYRQVVDEPRTPPAVRLGVWAEMAQCEQQRGDMPAALGDYDRMLDGAEGISPPVLAMLHAVDLAKSAGAEDRTRRWTLAALDVCERRGMEMSSDELEIAANRLRVLWAGPPGDIAGHLEQVERLAKARAMMAAFVLAHGPGPFHFWSGTRDFELATLPRRATAEAPLLLVDTRAALPDGSWLAFEVDPAGLRRNVLEPALRGLVARSGGNVRLAVTPLAGSAPMADSADQMIQALPLPLEFWSIEYRPRPSSMWATLAASRSKSRTAILGIAVALALLGLGVPFSYMKRSLRLAGLQADMMDRISHELKTPIAALSVLADTLERRGEPVDPATDRQLRTLLNEEVQRLARLSDRLLDFARQRAGVAPMLDREPVRLDTLLAEIVRRLPSETGAAADRLAFEIQPADYSGGFDREAMGAIVRNLVENAVKYSDSPVTVRISLCRTGSEAVLAVADNGWGMDERTLRHLFTPYFRADASLAARVPGLGLGLAIVQGLVRAHGGAITVRSTPGRGSVFEIRLPLSPDAGGAP
jgi:two-component system, OmpR family, phosphate regulon sensor histidine kinase PhoR